MTPHQITEVIVNPDEILITYLGPGPVSGDFQREYVARVPNGRQTDALKYAHTTLFDAARRALVDPESAIPPEMITPVKAQHEPGILEALLDRYQQACANLATGHYRPEYPNRDALLAHARRLRKQIAEWATERGPVRDTHQQVAELTTFMGDLVRANVDLALGRYPSTHSSYAALNRHIDDLAREVSYRLKRLDSAPPSNPATDPSHFRHEAILDTPRPLPKHETVFEQAGREQNEERVRYGLPPFPDRPPEPDPQQATTAAVQELRRSIDDLTRTLHDSDVRETITDHEMVRRITAEMRRQGVNVDRTSMRRVQGATIFRHGPGDSGGMEA